MKKRTVSVGTVNLKDGQYKGTFSGYEVTVRIHRDPEDGLIVHKSHMQDVTFKTHDGIRGWAHGVTVIVENGSAVVEF